jgi:hypothetical protein
MKKTQWMGNISACDICHKPITNVFVDGATNQGPWAIMCLECFKEYGVGLGTGSGQEYWKAEDGEFYKVDG